MFTKIQSVKCKCGSELKPSSVSNLTKKDKVFIHYRCIKCNKTMDICFKKEYEYEHNIGGK